MKKIIFYDLETTGKSAHWDQIIQIAAICTDEDFKVLDLNESNLIYRNLIGNFHMDKLTNNSSKMNLNINTKIFENKSISDEDFYYLHLLILLYDLLILIVLVTVP